MPTRRTTAAAPHGDRLLHAALARVDRLDPRDERWQHELSPLSAGLVDALLAADTDSLQMAVEALRDALGRLFDDGGHAREIRGWLLGALETTRSALERLPSPDELELPRGAIAWRMLTALGDGAHGGSELAQLLGTSASQVSRTGRDLLARDLVVQRRVGRHVRWEVAPRGRQVLSAAGEARAPHGDGARPTPRSAG